MRPIFPIGQIFEIFLKALIMRPKSMHYIVGCTNKNVGLFHKVLDTLELNRDSTTYATLKVHCFNFKVSKNLRKKPPILICTA